MQEAPQLPLNPWLDPVLPGLTILNTGSRLTAPLISDPTFRCLLCESTKFFYSDNHIFVHGQPQCEYSLHIVCLQEAAQRILDMKASEKDKKFFKMLECAKCGEILVLGELEHFLDKERKGAIEKFIKEDEKVPAKVIEEKKPEEIKPKEVPLTEVNERCAKLIKDEPKAPVQELHPMPESPIKDLPKEIPIKIDEPKPQPDIKLDDKPAPPIVETIPIVPQKEEIPPAKPEEPKPVKEEKKDIPPPIVPPKEKLLKSEACKKFIAELDEIMKEIPPAPAPAPALPLSEVIAKPEEKLLDFELLVKSPQKTEQKEYIIKDEMSGKFSWKKAHIIFAIDSYHSMKGKRLDMVNEAIIKILGENRGKEILFSCFSFGESTKEYLLKIDMEKYMSEQNKIDFVEEPARNYDNAFMGINKIIKEDPSEKAYLDIVVIIGNGKGIFNEKEAIEVEILKSTAGKKIILLVIALETEEISEMKRMAEIMKGELFCVRNAEVLPGKILEVIQPQESG